MTQEAAIAIWKNSNRFPGDPGRSRAYAFGCGVRHAMRYFVRIAWGKNPVAITTIQDDSIPTFYKPPEDNDPTASPLFHDLVFLFSAARVRGGERTRQAATRDAQIVILASRGWGNDAIASFLGLTPLAVKTYRQRARETLERLLEKGGKNEQRCTKEM